MGSLKDHTRSTMRSERNKISILSAGSEFWGGNRVPRRWRGRYTKTRNFAKMGDKNVLKLHQKA